MKELLTTKQVAKILQVSVETCRRYCREQKIKFIKLGNRHIRIKESDLKAFLKRQEV